MANSNRKSKKFYPNIKNQNGGELDRVDLKRMGIYCVNFTLRKAARTVTRYYDEVLEPCGITSTQHSILLAIKLNPEANVGKMAKLLAMDRTTLTRNLKLLERSGLVKFRKATDGRQKLVGLTKKGTTTFQKSIPMWTKAQAELLDILGDQNWRDTIINISRVLNHHEKEGL